MRILWILLIVWCVFVALVYLVLWFDTIYYKHNLPKLFKKMLDAFTEED